MRANGIIISFFLVFFSFSLFSQDQSGEMPKFAVETEEPVVFAYKFAVGQKINSELSTVVLVKMKTDKEDVILSKMSITLSGYYLVAGVNADTSAVIHFYLARIITTLANGKIYDSDTIEYSSADPVNSDIKKFIKKALVYKIDARGKIERIDGNIPVYKDKQENETFQQQLVNMVGKVMQNHFVQFPANLLKKGDRFIQKIEKDELPSFFGQVRTSVSYQIIAVSVDKKRALLQSIAELRDIKKNFTNPESSSMKTEIRQNELNGWILFDLENGRIRLFHDQFTIVLSMKMDTNDKKISNEINETMEQITHLEINVE
jgi:hypothetical protein